MVEYGLKCGLANTVFSYSQPIPAITRNNFLSSDLRRLICADHVEETVKGRMSYRFRSRCPKASASDNPPSPNGNYNRVH